MAWEATAKRTGPDFFAEHIVERLKGWSDHALEDQGRLTHPLRYNPEIDKYEAVEWDFAIREIGEAVRALDPKRIELYTSGRTSSEAAFLWQLDGRLIGTNNFPDCSDMCHATTTVALSESISVGKGTVTLDDWFTAPPASSGPPARSAAPNRGSSPNSPRRPCPIADKSTGTA